MKKYTFRNYLEYIRNNPKNYWFKRRLYGWGWVPVKLEGWIVIFAFILSLLLNGLFLASKEQPSNVELAFFMGIIFISIGILISICYKTGEKPQWSWGI